MGSSSKSTTNSTNITDIDTTNNTSYSAINPALTNSNDAFLLLGDGLAYSSVNNRDTNSNNLTSTINLSGGFNQTTNTTTLDGGAIKAGLDLGVHALNSANFQAGLASASINQSNVKSFELAKYLIDSEGVKAAANSLNVGKALQITKDANQAGIDGYNKAFSGLTDNVGKTYTALDNATKQAAAAWQSAGAELSTQNTKSLDFAGGIFDKALTAITGQQNALIGLANPDKSVSENTSKYGLYALGALVAVAFLIKKV